MAAIGVPVELGLVGGLLILLSASRGPLPRSAHHLAYWALIVAGVYSVMGVPCSRSASSLSFVSTLIIS
jgi:hypothetical protein